MLVLPYWKAHLRLVLLLLLSFALVSVVNAQTPTLDEVEIQEPLDDEELDTLLAPVALYPDTLLSHILIAASYPLEVVEAARWRAKHPDLDANEVLEASEDKDWDPSVKALLPFTELLTRMSEDLDWTRDLGEANLADEEQVLARIQYLRRQAYSQGNLTSNEHVVVEEEPQVIRVETIKREVVYVPYYDSRIVYGDWWWHRPPVYWPQSGLSVGIHWGHSVVVRPSFYFSAFHWHNRHIVVNYDNFHHRSYHYPSHYWYRYDARRWQHNLHHRRGVRYHKPRAYRQVTYNRENGQVGGTVHVNRVRSEPRFKQDRVRVVSREQPNAAQVQQRHSRSVESQRQSHSNQVIQHQQRPRQQHNNRQVDERRYRNQQNDLANRQALRPQVQPRRVPEQSRTVQRQQHPQVKSHSVQRQHQARRETTPRQDKPANTLRHSHREPKQQR
ncbi:DUF3300 domain-containing protein [Bowmanella denitrificans]|uniref:DUF3300 domain-containing protein n=1 Tax=Bowmanella denitrificans TaxID=366582 RepID=UPI000C9B28A9|nr:DUF3300 domain-containing protein [Bowmanella denitrificans]